MNTYCHRFSVDCPNNGQHIDYALRIRSQHVIMAEEIVAACVSAKDIEKPYHENIADMLHAKFGGRQRLVAFHHGVKIKTRRGA